MLADVLGAAASEIHHIGSTSVPGLPAKDTLDILVATPSIALVLQHEQALNEAGYDAKGPFPGRPHHYFVRRLEGGRRKVHLHVVEQGDSEVDAYLLFRDFLRADDAARTEYADDKLRLAQSSRDREEYVTTKVHFVDGLIARAREWEASNRE